MAGKRRPLWVTGGRQNTEPHQVINHQGLDGTAKRENPVVQQQRMIKERTTIPQQRRVGCQGKFHAHMVTLVK